MKSLQHVKLGWSHAPFEIPADVYAGWDNKEQGQAAEQSWDDKFAAYAAAYPELAAEYKRRVNNELPAEWEAKSSAYIADLQANQGNIAHVKLHKTVSKLTAQYCLSY